MAGPLSGDQGRAREMVVIGREPSEGDEHCVLCVVFSFTPDYVCEVHISAYHLYLAHEDAGLSTLRWR